LGLFLRMSVVIEYDFFAFTELKSYFGMGVKFGVPICLRLIGMIILTVMNHQIINVDIYLNRMMDICCVCPTIEFFGKTPIGLPKNLPDDLKQFKVDTELTIG
jgi:hypothetical protein